MVVVVIVVVDVTGNGVVVLFVHKQGEEERGEE